MGTLSWTDLILLRRIDNEVILKKRSGLRDGVGLWGNFFENRQVRRQAISHEFNVAADKPFNLEKSLPLIPPLALRLS